jgi:hypothetical protein
MCGGGEPDRIGNVIAEIKKLKKDDVDDELKKYLYYVVKKLEEIVDARPKQVEDDEKCPCGCN